MDPVTLYIVLKMANGNVRPIERAFVDGPACEEHVSKLIKPRTDAATIIRYECVGLPMTPSAPSWYVEYAPPKRIEGVPLSLELQPRH